MEQALKHPNWSMGAKVTIDSATLMNKGLELIEAHHLFALPSEQIDVLVHPQSIVHGLVEFCDGSLIAQLGSPDMRIPIAYCLAWPERIQGPAPRLDLARACHFDVRGARSRPVPGVARSRAVRSKRAAVHRPCSMPRMRVAVGEFLERRLAFGGIPALVEATLEAAVSRNWTAEPQSVEDALSIDHNSRLLARELLPEIAAKASLDRSLASGGSQDGDSRSRWVPVSCRALARWAGGVLGYRHPVSVRAHGRRVLP